MSGTRFLVTFVFLICIAFAYSRIYGTGRYADKNVKQDVVNEVADEVIKSVGYRHSPAAFAGVEQEKYFNTIKGKLEKEKFERLATLANPEGDFRSKKDFLSHDLRPTFKPDFQTPDQWQSFPRSLEERAAVQRNLGSRQETLPGSRFNEQSVSGLDNDVRRKIYDVNDPNKTYNLDNQRIIDSDPEGSRAVAFKPDSYYNKDQGEINHERNNASAWDPNVKRYLSGKHPEIAKVEQLWNAVPELPVPAAVNASTVYDNGANRPGNACEAVSVIRDDDKTKRELRMQGASGWYSKSTPHRQTDPTSEGPRQWRELLGETFRVNDISKGSKKDGIPTEQVRPYAKNASSGKFNSDVLSDPKNKDLGPSGYVPSKTTEVSTQSLDQKDDKFCTVPHIEGSMDYNDNRVLKRFIPDPHQSEHHYPTNTSQMQEIDVS